MLIVSVVLADRDPGVNLPASMLSDSNAYFQHVEQRLGLLCLAGLRLLLSGSVQTLRDAENFFSGLSVGGHF